MAARRVFFRMMQTRDGQIVSNRVMPMECSSLTEAKYFCEEYEKICNEMYEATDPCNSQHTSVTIERWEKL